MSTSPSTEVLLGCDPQVRVVITEDEGNLFLQVFAEDPENTDMDALFFNLTDDSLAEYLTLSPGFDESIGSNGDNVTGYDISPGSLNASSSGAQIQDAYDVRLEFGTTPWTSGGDVDLAQMTFYIDGGPRGLTVDDIDVTHMTAVVNSDGGNGIALTGGTGSAPQQVPTVVTVTEDFDSLHSADQSDLIASDGNWDVQADALYTNGSNDGALTLETVATEGPATFSFDAHVVNPDAFENSGQYADSLRVEVSIDGGAFVLLDEFEVNDAGTMLVGSDSGQTFGTDSSQISYSGGVLDTATESVQFRVVSDISAHNEVIVIDDLEISVTELDDGAGPAPVIETTLLEENFDDVLHADDSDAVDRDGNWDVYGDQLRTDGRNDGTLEFAEVSTSDPVTLTLDMKANDLDNFENEGRYEDSLRVEVQIDGGEWVLLDEFQVNDDGTAMVGSLTGQTFDEDYSTLDYSGGVLDTAQSDVQFRLVSDISACNEKIYVDNVSLVSISDDGQAPHPAACEDFEAADAGDTAALQFDGVSITAQRDGDAPDSQNDAMIFDTDNPTGGDNDLHYSDQGNAIIISEDNDADDPDDNAHGGTITFEFDVVSDVTSLTVLDVEEEGGAIDLYDLDGELINSIAIPAAGDNSEQDIAINASGVATMTVTLAGSGAVDDLCFSDTEGDDTCGQYDVTYDDWMITDPLPEDAEEAREEDILDEMLV